MLLADSKIIEYQKKGIIYIDNFDEKKVNPNSYNLTLSDKLKVYTSNCLDMKKDNETEEIIIPSEGLLLEPGKLYIGSTNEYTKTLDPLTPMIVGRSSIARLGITVEISAGFGDNGFEGSWTLEISVVQPVKVYPNVDICQIYYLLNEGECLHPYKGKYKGQIEATSSRLFKDFETDKKDEYATTNVLDNGHINYSQIQVWEHIEFVLRDESGFMKPIFYKCIYNFLNHQSNKLYSQSLLDIKECILGKKLSYQYAIKLCELIKEKSPMKIKVDSEDERTINISYPKVIAGDTVIFDMSETIEIEK